MARAILAVCYFSFFVVVVEGVSEQNQDLANAMKGFIFLPYL